jgi:hypothetical protein
MGMVVALHRQVSLCKRREHGIFSPNHSQRIDRSEVIRILNDHTAGRQRRLLSATPRLAARRLVAAEAGCGDERARPDGIELFTI